jgi:hypothetical protein
VARRIRSIEKFYDLIGNPARDLPACSIVPQPTTLPLSPNMKEEGENMKDGQRNDEKKRIRQ